MINKLLPFNPIRSAIAVSLSLALIGCGDNQNTFDNVAPPEASAPDPVPPVVETIQAFDNDGSLDATIRWTTYGVPHVSADNLESMSNGWGLGSDKTANGKGMVLGNPHFPHTGNLRFWQFHARVPGHLNVLGGSLMGLPGAVNIGFNENVAWTHTFSTAEHFVVYQLSLDETDTSGMTHSVDGSPRIIYEKPMQIEVAVGPGQTVTMAKTGYYTNYSLIIEVPGSFDWNSTNAFAIIDANLANFDVVDHWLAMNMAGDMEEFKQAFKDYDGGFC